MACLKGVAVPLNWTMILAAALSLLVPSASAQKCPSVFSSTVDIGGFDETVELVFTMDETTPSGTELYELSWDDDCVAPPDITDENFNKYFFVNDTVDCAWIVSVNEDLIGLPDYPGLQNLFTITVTFDGFTTIDYTQCDVTLTHVLKDANTQKPKPSQAAYAVNIKEDFSPHYTIPGFNTPVRDMDATSPNNEFSVSVDSNCPLESTQSTYTSGQNSQAVEYLLKEAVNYEKGDTIVCTVTFEDKGTTPLSDSTTITITVQDVNDEPPIFTHDYYYSVVSSVLNPGNALDISPSEISASDGDTGINDTITYSMKDANPDVNGMDYFSIKENTGEVVMLETLDNDFLLNERVLFFVQAQESSGATSHTLLEMRLPWVNLVCGGFHFEQAVYLADIFHGSTGDVVRVAAVTNATEDPKYSLSGTGSQYFSIDASTGQISVNQDNPPPINLHKMEAVATITTSPSETATTKVTINVISQTFDKVAILSSIIKATVEEDAGEQELASVALSDTASKVCVIGADPSDMRDRFTVEKKTGTEWKLKTTGALDYEATREVTVYLQAYTDEAPEDCSSVNTEIPDVFMKSQALAIITVTNTNDEAPQFSSDSLVAAHPTNEGLKRVAGPVVSVEAKDPDSSVVTYSLEGEDAAGFTVDDATGEVYGVEGLTCDPECKFNVKASDGSYEDQVAVKVLPLDTDHVFTILMSDTDLSDVDEKLNDLTTKTGAQISMLYVSPTESTARRGGMRYRRETTMDLEVHVYSIKDGKLMSRDELNSALTDSSSGVQAEEFIDADVFEAVTQEDTTGLKVAVGVLGALLGIVLIAGVAFFVYQKKRGKPAPKQGKPPTPISTLGQAYQNPSYTNDNSPSQVNLGSESLGHKSNGSLNGYAGASLNGYTSAEVHRHPNDESPPLHRSPLAPPTDSIPLRNRDTQQQGGLKRTSPGAPEYYGSSSPAPPPSFSSTTSPSFPIYAEIKKPKDPMPAPDKKIQEDTDEEDNLPDNKFTSVKHSPPPRRSTKYDDDDDDDQDEDTAYPGGKHAGFTDEPAEEKKSVAFKVKVETKEIEAENMGPAQKKAEATKLMEANRKKLQEEGNDDDEDDDDEDTKTLRL